MTVASAVLIDDEPDFARSLTAAFKASGLELDSALTWEDGLTLFRVGLHELVIADYNLPGSKLGLKLLLEVQRLRPSSRLLLVSAAVTPSASDLIAAGDLVDRYLAKDSTVMERLVEEGQAAQTRATAPPDWRRIGSAHLARRTVTDSAIEAVDQALRIQLP